MACDRFLKSFQKPAYHGELCVSEVVSEMVCDRFLKSFQKWCLHDSLRSWRLASTRRSCGDARCWRRLWTSTARARARTRRPPSSTTRWGITRVGPLRVQWIFRSLPSASRYIIHKTSSSVVTCLCACEHHSWSTLHISALPASRWEQLFPAGDVDIS